MATAEPATDFYGALHHPTRRGIVALLSRSKRPLSPAELADILDRSLSTVAYHTRVLCEDFGILTLTDKHRVRGSVEHFYVLSEIAKESRMVREAAERTEVPEPLPEPRQPPTEATFTRFAAGVLTQDERRLVEHRKGWNGREQLSRTEAAIRLRIGADKVRHIERSAMYKVERAKFEDDQRQTHF